MNEATWELHNGLWRCTHCKGNAIETVGGYIAITTYCPFCGYKMSMEGLTNGRHQMD